MPSALFVVGTIITVIFVDNATADTPNKNSTSMLIPLGEKIKDVAIGNTEKTIVIKSDATAFNLHKTGAKLGCLEVDVSNALNYLEYSPLIDESGAGTTNVWVRISGPNDADTVCKTGDCWGTYNLTSNAEGKLSNVTPTKAAASGRSLNLLNDSSFTLCLGVTTPAPGSISATKLPVSYCLVPAGCSKLPADIAGYWKSEYSCNDSCEGAESGQSVTLYITQNNLDKTKATYIDTEGGKYSGTVCGNTFTYTGGGPDWSESGTIVFNNANSATKTSQYSTHGKCCVGRCNDKLVKQSKAPDGVK